MTELDNIAAQLGDNTSDETSAVKEPPVGMPKTIKIILEESDDIPPTGLFVGVNGYGYMIRAGEPVDVPPSVKENLDHAVLTVAQIDPSTRRVIGYRKRHRFPYRLAQPSDALVSV